MTTHRHATNSNDPKETRCSCETDEEVLAKASQQPGGAPAPFQLMALRPGTLSSFACYRNQVFEDGPLGAKERALVQFAAAVALRLTHCIGKRAGDARKAGASQDEIVQTALIVSLQAGTSLLHSAYEGIVEK